MRKKLSVISIFISALLFVSCGSSKSTMDSSTSSGEVKPSYDTAEKYEGVQNSVTEDSIKEENIYNSSDERKIINKADLTVETIEFDNSLTTLEKLTGNLEGYIESSNIYQAGISKWNYNDNRSAEFVIRIPKNNFQKFLNDSGNLGTVTNKRVYGDDITTQYYDRDARLKVLKAQEERYLEILNKAENIEQVLEVEKYLTEVRYEIETITASIKQMDKLVDYSTVNINISEVITVSEAQKVPTTLGEKIVKVFSDSIKSLKTVGTGLILAFIAVIPYGVIILIIAGIVYYSIRTIKKNIKNKKK